ncbi:MULTISPECIES: M6 family metalloprotease domain-containing protein [Streptomyces]|uniref:M6 family metalloprotease domain-containing protein n=1 Tax=Streptomyces lonegramiae TaxID=3075524 RepID=A0ABU2XJ69_9ACTN|nr:M6 family metalloprotease domain-containing protein [Streptomyces sp. DSM 41529]MDT0545979.1 M6 family metalloprotease domain-containing protein [Streptomyces sp. DSM 41529]
MKHSSETTRHRTRHRTRPRIRRPRRGSVFAATAVLTVTVAAAPVAVPGPPPAAPAPPVRAPALPANPAYGALAPCALIPGEGLQMTEGLPTGPGYAPSAGTVKALTLMIDFPDIKGRGTARKRYAEFFPQTSRWFKRSSYGRLKYRSTAPIKHWLRMPHSFRSYGIKRGSPFEPGYRRLVADIAKVAGPKVDFSRYDLVNVLVTPNAGPPAARAVLSVTYSGNQRAPVADGVPLANVSFVYSRQDDGSGTLSKTGYRVLPHENGHVFGLPDLYTRRGGESAGHWDIMSEDWGAGNDLLAWHKWKLGWLGAGQVDCVARPGITRRALRPLGRAGGTKLIFVPVSKYAGYAVEARTNEGNDEAVCKPGVLVSWVDTQVDSGRGPITVVDSTPGSGGCTDERNVHPGLSDAAFTPGETFTGGALGTGVRVRVTERDSRGDYRVEITRYASGGGRG